MTKTFRKKALMVFTIVIIVIIMPFSINLKKIPWTSNIIIGKITDLDYYIVSKGRYRTPLTAVYFVDGSNIALQGDARKLKINKINIIHLKTAFLIKGYKIDKVEVLDNI